MTCRFGYPIHLQTRSSTRRCAVVVSCAIAWCAGLWAQSAEDVLLRAKEEARAAAKQCEKLRSEAEAAETALDRAGLEVLRLQREEGRLEESLKGELRRALKEAKDEVGEADEALTVAEARVSTLRERVEAARKAADTAQAWVDDTIIALGKETSAGMRRKIVATLGRAKREAMAKEAAYWRAKEELAGAEMEATWRRRALKASREEVEAVLAQAPELKAVLRRTADAVAAEAVARMKTEELRRRLTEQRYSERMGSELQKKESAMRGAYNRSAQKRALARSSSGQLAAELGMVRKAIQKHVSARQQAEAVAAEVGEKLRGATESAEAARTTAERLKAEQVAAKKGRKRDTVVVEREAPEEAETTGWDRFRAAREEKRSRRRLAKEKAEQKRRVLARVREQAKAVGEKERELALAELEAQTIERRIEALDRACREMDSQLKRSEARVGAASSPEAKAEATAVVQHERRVASVLTADREKARDELGNAKQRIRSAREGLGTSRSELAQAKLAAATVGGTEKAGRGTRE